MKTAFSALVFGDYDRFIPYYIYSIRKVYPESDIILFYTSTVEVYIRSYCQKIDKVHLHENFFKEYSEVFKKYRIRGGGQKLLRHLIPGSYFNAYDMVYFGDVDILILKESSDLFSFHKAQIDQCSLPFSNKVRLLSNGGFSNRLTGLHCVEVRKYYEKMTSLQERILIDDDFRNQFMAGIERDEQLLYKLNLIGFNFDIERVSQNERPWHGFHLGLVRDRMFLNEQTVKENSNISLTKIKNQLRIYTEDQEFLELMKKTPSVEVYFTMRHFEIYLPLDVRMLYLFLRYKKKVADIAKQTYRSINFKR